MHLSPPMKRYVATLASHGSSLEQNIKLFRYCFFSDTCWHRFEDRRWYSRSSEEGDVHESRNADHLLFGQDGLHGLLDGVERLERRDQTAQLLPEMSLKNKSREVG